MVRRRIEVAAALGAIGIVPPWMWHQALAAAAGTLFEAAPFVLAIALVPRGAVRRIAALAGCGCGRSAGPAALSLPATALCWVAFGPVVALARFCAAVVLHAARHRDRGADAAPDPLGELAAIAAPAFVFGLITTALATGGAGHALHGLPGPAVFVTTLFAGLAAGAFAPCATAAVATAAMVRTAFPAAAAGVLASAGLVPAWRPRSKQSSERDAGLGLALLGVACGLLAWHGGSGLVHPRFVPLLWLAALASFAAVRAKPVTSARFALVPPLAMLAALAFGSPLPAPPDVASTLDDVYPGEPIAFLGRATIADGRTTLVRYAITCCRADATAIVIPTDLRARIDGDAWLSIRGTIVEDATGAVVHTTAWRRVAPPADPFTYR